MEGWRTERLGDLCEIVKGRKPKLKALASEGDLPYLVARVMRGSQEPEFASVGDRNSIAVSEDETRMRVLATNPLTEMSWRQAAEALMGRDGKAVSVIGDSAGFVTQRVIAMIVAIGSDMCQQGICSPADLDLAARLALGYPAGPLELGDAHGAAVVARVLDGMHRVTGDPRYRSPPWLRRRALLGASLCVKEMAASH